MNIFDVENCNVLHVTFTCLLGVNTEDTDQSVLPMAAQTDQQYRVMDKLILWGHAYLLTYLYASCSGAAFPGIGQYHKKACIHGLRKSKTQRTLLIYRGKPESYRV